MKRACLWRVERRCVWVSIIIIRIRNWESDFFEETLPFHWMGIFIVSRYITKLPLLKRTFVYQTLAVLAITIIGVVLIGAVVDSVQLTLSYGLPVVSLSYSPAGVSFNFSVCFHAASSVAQQQSSIHGTVRPNASPHKRGGYQFLCQ